LGKGSRAEAESLGWGAEGRCIKKCDGKRRFQKKKLNTGGRKIKCRDVVRNGHRVRAKNRVGVGGGPKWEGI